MQEREFLNTLGRPYEVGFNAGCIVFLYHHKKNLQFKPITLYQEDLKKLHWTSICNQILDDSEIDSPLERHIAEEWLLFFLQKGFLSGYNFLHEFLSSLGWLDNNVSPPTVHIDYLQCVFWKENSGKTIIKHKKDVLIDWLTQLNLDAFIADLFHQPARFEAFIKEYEGKGCFLNADSLFLLHRGDEWRILSIDMSIFSIQSLQDLVDTETVANLRHLLARELAHLQGKSAFADLNVEPDAIDFHFVEGLNEFMSAFRREDKEAYKLIQAASYAENFAHFLREHQIIPHQAHLSFHVVGYTDRGICSMNIPENQEQWLKACANIYRNGSSKPLPQARLDVFKVIQQNVAQCFTDGTKFLKNISQTAQNNTSAWVTHEEELEGFLSSMSIPPYTSLPQEVREQLGSEEQCKKPLRDLHHDLIHKALLDPSVPLVFLTGNPGIGKTTSVIKFLKEYIHQGFLFFYVSPRTQVNEDVVTKLYDSDTGALDPRLCAVTTNASMIQRYGKPIVQYLAHEQKIFTERNIAFYPWKSTIPKNTKSSSKIKRLTEDELEVTLASRGGVLQCLCKALSILLSKPETKALVATVATQSLRKTSSSSTLSHLPLMFQHLINKFTREISTEGMRALSGRIKYIVFMIDEITGAESGAEFLHGVRDFLEQMNLLVSPYGFQTKIIVADASIVETGVIQRHLAQTDVEPDKIYFQLKSRDLAPPLTYEKCQFGTYDAIIINANSYPARSLKLQYRVLLDVQPQKEKTSQKDLLDDQINNTIVKDLLTCLDRSDGQVIVYIQHKPRLNEIIRLCEGLRPPFKRGEHYLPIHANISENEKDLIIHKKDEVQVIFMTASASRGLSFPKARYILVDVPRFAIEQNLMEIIQVIYRGRGEYKEEGIKKTLDDQKKELIFYFAEQVKYPTKDTNRTLTINESLLDLLNLLVILKASILTRIQGYGVIGWENCAMIPIGGKSLSSVGNSLSERIQQLIKALQNEAHNYYDRPHLKHIAGFWKQVFENANYWQGTSNRSKQDSLLSQSSYHQLRKEFASQFLSAIRNGFEHLLSLPPMELGYIEGHFLIVPLANKDIEENYLAHVIKLLQKDEKNIKGQMLRIAESDDHPKQLQLLMWEAIRLWDEILQGNQEKNQAITQVNKGPDYYYAIPLFTFLHYKNLQSYFASSTENDTILNFRDILAYSIQKLYPVDMILPIGSNYLDYPFVIFRSLNLPEIRKKMFQSRHLFTSHEFGILNIILANDQQV